MINLFSATVIEIDNGRNESYMNAARRKSKTDFYLSVAFRIRTEIALP